MAAEGTIWLPVVILRQVYDARRPRPDSLPAARVTESPVIAVAHLLLNELNESGISSDMQDSGFVRRAGAYSSYPMKNQDLPCLFVLTLLRHVPYSTLYLVFRQSTIQPALKSITAWKICTLVYCCSGYSKVLSSPVLSAVVLLSAGAHALH